MQTEKANFTKREKMLIAVVLIGGSLALMIQFVLLPMNTRLENLRVELEDVTFRKAQVERQLGRVDALEEEHEEALLMYAELGQLYIPDSSSSAVSRIMTDLCFVHGLSPVDQRITEKRDFIIPGSTGEPLFSAMTVNMTVEGGYSEIARLLDTVDQRDYVRVSRNNFNRRITDEGIEFGRITFQFEVLMKKDDM
jgi:hypothetical protein